MRNRSKGKPGGARATRDPLEVARELLSGIRKLEAEAEGAVLVSSPEPHAARRAQLYELLSEIRKRRAEVEEVLAQVLAARANRHIEVLEREVAALRALVQA